MNIAYFISPHGFGHAARSTAVMEAIHARYPAACFSIFTRVPRWFFETSLSFSFDYYDLESDVGLVQDSPLTENLSATLARLDRYLTFSNAQLDPLVRNIQASGFSLAICDISPLGIAAARNAGIPSVLIENFTWDWIYAGYLSEERGFSRYIPILRDVFQSTDYHVQTTPVCAPLKNPAMVTNPVARKPRQIRSEIREKLQIPDDAKAVLISMGGFELQYHFIDRLAGFKEVYFIIPGGSNEVKIDHNLILLPHHSEFYHPDLIHASDAVISKAGYSTIAEAYFAGIPFGYVSRNQFRESSILSSFIQSQMQGFEIDGTTFQSGSWKESIPRLLDLPKTQRKEANGADQIADWLINRFVNYELTSEL